MRQRATRLFRTNPEALIAVSFLTAIVIGALLLRLPQAVATGDPLTGIDALFMATSAVCVTGLSVIDIGSELTLFGQLVILALIQTGGLGIMTFSLLFFVLLGRRVSLCGRSCVDSLSHELDMDNFRFALAKIFTLAVGIEIIGAFLLFVALRQVHPPPLAAYSALFHAVSAFCNAGFSLYQDSLSGFLHHPYAQTVVMVLIILGGLGFVVINELLSRFMRRIPRQRLSLHSKIAVTGTLAFISAGAVGIYLLEKNNVLAGLVPVSRVVNSLFLSVTSRTAGFNTLPTHMLTNPALCLVIVLMFIGACSGSTSGGIKISTFFTLLSAIVTRVRGEHSASLFHRRFPAETIDRALTVFITALLIIFVMVFALQVTEGVVGQDARERGLFLNLLFEAVSAFGTVGLSTGATAHLTSPGKFIIILLMFIGRVGLLTLAVALQMRRRRTVKYEYPQEDVLIG